MSGRHLTVVEKNAKKRETEAPRRLVTNKQGQFQMELKDGEVRHILIIAMDAVHGTKLTTVVDKFTPTSVIDLRQTLRFDQPGSSRAAFFGRLSRIRSTYYREPVEWPKLQAWHLSAGQLLPMRLYHEAVERWEGHIALLVSKMEHGRYLASALNRALSEHRPDGWDIEQVV